MKPLFNIPIIESPLFEQKTKDFSDELKRIALDLHLKGYSVIDFPDDEFNEKAELIKAQLDPFFADKNTTRRIHDAWKVSDAVQDIASNHIILNMLNQLYGRKAFPFQTISFKFGSEQHYHSDTVHFNSSPERFMCGVWVALEDITESNGPLFYFPKSHTWPIVSNEMMGFNVLNANQKPTQEIYYDAWNAMVNRANCEPEKFLAKKGQALIWAANLLHGGLPIIDKNQTRWSQVTHYFFENCCYFIPMLSNVFLGNIYYKNVIDITTKTSVQQVSCGQMISEDVLNFKGGRTLPENFDADVYLDLNKDVLAAGVDPKEHWLDFGRYENRKFY